MVANPSNDPGHKTTLIIAPLALLPQWKEEIENKCSIDYQILLYHGSYDKPQNPRTILKNDIVITTFGTLTSEWTDDEALLKDIASGASKPRKHKSGPLMDIDWYRIVIDEAHTIRTPRAKCGRAVAHLKATLRWSLTGTPICNTLMDIFPQLRFLKIRPYNDITEFRAHISRHEKKRPNLAGKRAQAVLKTFMLRRLKTSTLDGKPLIILPTKHIEQVMLDMDSHERELYNCLESRMQIKFNKFLKAGTVLKVRSPSDM